MNLVLMSMEFDQVGMGFFIVLVKTFAGQAHAVPVLEMAVKLHV